MKSPNWSLSLSLSLYFNTNFIISFHQHMRHSLLLILLYFSLSFHWSISLSLSTYLAVSLSTHSSLSCLSLRGKLAGPINPNGLAAHDKERYVPGKPVHTESTIRPKSRPIPIDLCSTIISMGFFRNTSMIGLTDRENS